MAGVQRFYAGESPAVFEAEFQEARRHSGESVTDFGYCLQSLFMKGYPPDPNFANNANDAAMRFTVLRSKFLAGLEPELGFKLKYTLNLATFDDLVVEAQQQDLRLRERRLLQEKREYVLSITQDNNVLNSTLVTILERITILEKDRNQSSSISAPNGEKRLWGSVLLVHFLVSFLSLLSMRNVLFYIFDTSLLHIYMYT